MRKKLEFVDLFCGIGGFHLALSQLGYECVFACDIDKYAVQTYLENFGIDAFNDIRNINAADIPRHDILCAGFPCVAFSKAGKQQGFKDQTRGTLFFEVARILEYHHSKYIVLENVRNLTTHDHGNTWEVIKGTLKDLGYRLTPNPLILSPHQFGIPQLRERVVILGKYDPENVDLPLSIEFSNLKGKNDNTVYSVISPTLVEKQYYISEHEKYILQAWDEFRDGVSFKKLGFPIWANAWKEESIPDNYPDWKKNYIQKNKYLYESNRIFIDEWLEKYDNLNSFTETEKKFEWQAGSDIDSIWEGVIQIRPSGIRVKSPTCFPALVAMVHIPIIGRYKRRITPREAAALQSFPVEFVPNSNVQQAYKQFGNSVNVDIIRKCVQKLTQDDGQIKWLF